MTLGGQGSIFEKRVGSKVLERLESFKFAAFR
jgi:hypothetical protein